VDVIARLLSAGAQLATEQHRHAFEGNLAALREATGERRGEN